MDGPLEHIYKYFQWNINICRGPIGIHGGPIEDLHIFPIPDTFAHISNEILTFWISCNTFTHISNEILTSWNNLHTSLTHLHIFQIKYWDSGSVGTHFNIFQTKYYHFERICTHPLHICTYFKRNIYMLDQLEHIYTYF